MPDLDPLNDPHLVCHGCAFSLAEAPYPGEPVEHACLTCSRNPEVRKNGVDPQRAQVMHERQPKIPMDLYTPLDRLKMDRDKWHAADRLLDDLAARSAELPVDLAERVRAQVAEAILRRKR